MNLNLAVHMKESVSPLIIEKMIIIIIITITITLCAATFFFAVNFGAKAYAQENNINTNNNTLLLEDMRALMREQQGDLSSIRNTSSAQFEALTQMSASFGKLQTQATYTALSVFFLGIGLVVFGLSLTTRSSPRIGKYLTLTIWSLVTPVIILVGLFQYGAFSGNNPLAVFRSDPFIPLSFLMYIPIAIVLFLLLAQRKIMHVHAAQAAQAQAQAAQASSQAKKDPYQELERLGSLKQQGLITEEEFQELKTRLLSGT
jgi:flagellar basal body-associated protein FliL